MDFSLVTQAIAEIVMMRIDRREDAMPVLIKNYNSYQERLVPSQLTTREIEDILKRIYDKSSPTGPMIINDAVYFKMWYQTNSELSWEAFIDQLASSICLLQDRDGFYYYQLDERSRQQLPDEGGLVTLLLQNTVLVFILCLVLAPSIIDEEVLEIIKTASAESDITIIQGQV